MRAQTVIRPKVPGGRQANGRRSAPMAQKISTLNKFHDTAVLPLKKKMPIKKLALALTCLCLAAMTMIWLQLQIDNLSQQITSLEQQRNDMQSANRFLRQELDESINFNEVFGIVNSQYGMDFPAPESEQVILEVPDNILLENSKN